MKMRSYNFCHTNTKNPGNNLGIFCLITGRPKLNGYDTPATVVCFSFPSPCPGENAFSLAGSKRFRATACKIVTGKSCQESRHFFLDLDYVTETDSTVTIKNGGVAQIGC